MFPAESQIVVVDDAASMVLFIETALVQLGYKEISTASNGSEAWDILNTMRIIGNKPDLIIADWLMPVMSGLDLLKKVRADSHFYDVPFLMVTSEAEMPSVMLAIKAGVSNYIVKPFDLSLLKEKMAAVWSKHNP